MGDFEVTSELLADLRQKAEAIGLEYMEWEYSNYSGHVVTKDDRVTIADTYGNESQARFITAANPAVVLALVAEIERLRGQHDLPDGYEIEALGLTQGMGW